MHFSPTYSSNTKNIFLEEILMHAAYGSTVTINFFLVFLCKPCIFLKCALSHALDPVTCLSVKPCPSLRRCWRHLLQRSNPLTYHVLA